MERDFEGSNCDSGFVHEASELPVGHPRMWK